MRAEQTALFPLAEEAERLEGPGGRLLTAEQSAAVRARVGSRLLYANAGSGKTAVIVERFARAVLEDGVDPRRILAITFTDRAAGELKDRLRRRLLELGARAAARAAEGAYVSTIHGFCARVLRAHPFAAGIDPEFRVLDEAETRRLRADAFATALAGFLDEAARTGPAALELAAAYRPDRLARLLHVTYARLRSRGHTAPRLPPVAPRLVPPATRERLARARDALAVRLTGAVDGATVERARTALERCASLLAVAEHPMPGDLEAARFAPGNAAALRLPETDDYLHALDAYRTAVADALAADACGLLGELLAGYGAEYERAKRARSGLDFEDLELMTRDLLRSDPGVRRAYAERFDLLMVDELQDVNRRQLEILELLERDNLLTVGDELQSIYGFRHADVALFRARRERLAAAGRATSLAANFRSRGPLLDVVNAAFGPIFGEGFVPLADGREDAREVAGPLVELLVTDQRGWEDAGPGESLPPTAAWRHAEARLLARRVRELVDGRPGEETGGGSRVRAGDVAVLVRALGDLAVYQRALEEEGLGTYVAGAGGYWSAQQVRDLVAYLGALANPQDELRMFALLASPLGGIGSDGLALLARARGRLGRDAWWALEQAFCPGGDGSDGLAEELPEADAARLAGLCPWFAAERRDAPRRGLDELIERAVTARGYDLHVLSLPGGVRRLANVRKLARLAREYEAHEGRDLRGFLDWVALREDADVAEAEAPVETEGLDAVRLMSIHAAKGLEFGVVCVADTGRPAAVDLPDLHVSADGRVGLRIVSLDGSSVAALDYDALQAQALEEAEAEERRVFYVACTRARERLIVSGSVPSRESWPAPRAGGRPISWLGPALAPGVESHLTPERPRWTAPTGVTCVLNAPGTLGHAPPGKPQTSETSATPPPTPTTPLPAPAGSLPVRTLSYSGLGAYARCGYRFYLERSLGLPRVEPPAVEGGEPGLPAHVRGTLVHLLLEGLDFARPRAPEPVAVAALAAEQGIGLGSADAEEVAGLVASFARGPLCRRLAAAQRVHREAPFAFPLAAPAGEVLMTGIVDVLAREDDRALIVDYKSDRLEVGDDLAARTERDYGVQRLVYALAALREGAGEVEVAHCFLERPDEPVRAAFDASRVAELEAELSGLAEGALAGEFRVSERPHRGLCGDCPGRPGLCSWESEMTLRDPVSGPAARRPARPRARR